MEDVPLSKKVPGSIPRINDHALAKDLTKLSKRELLDLRSRLRKLLESKSQLSKLPDKGQKIQLLYDRACQAVSAQNEIENASKLFEKLNLSSQDVNEMEWSRNVKSNRSHEEMDSDDEDPMVLLASSNSTTGNRKIVRVLKDEEDNSLITADDLKEVESLRLEPVVEQLCANENMEPSHRFLPNKPNPSKVKSSNSSLNSQDGLPKKRENTAATPPICGKTLKQLTLRESIELEHAHLKRMQENQEKQAVERLAFKSESTTATVNFKPDLLNVKSIESSIMTKYRDVTSIVGGEHSDESDHSGEEDNIDYGADD